MKRIIEKANTEQLDKLWSACYDLTRACYEIEEANTPIERLELKYKHELIGEAEKVLLYIMREENKREREKQNEETNEESDSEQEEGAI